MTIHHRRNDFPDVSRVQENIHARFPESTNSLEEGALIGGLVVLVIVGIFSLISYFKYGELIHFPWGNEGEGYHWPNSNHGLLPLIKEKIQAINDEVKSINSLEKGALIGGLIVLVIIGLFSLISYCKYGELIHFPWGNEGEGYHWPNSNHGLLPLIKEKIQTISNEIKSKL